MAACAASGSGEQRREYNEQKELENLHRVFVIMDQNGDGRVDFKELSTVLARLDYKAKKAEARHAYLHTMEAHGATLTRRVVPCQVEDMIWEVDEDCDKCVSWEEFKLMFERCSSDKARHCHHSRTGHHPTAHGEWRAAAQTGMALGPA